VWHLSFLLMNSFNETEAAIFPCRMCFLRAFPFISFIYLITAGVSACVAAVKCRPVLHHCLVIFFSGPRGSWIVYCLHLKIEFCSCARGASMAWHLSLHISYICNNILLLICLIVILFPTYTIKR